MPNYCNYDMRIVGKKMDVDSFLNVIKYKDDNKYFCRVFTAEPYFENTDENTGIKTLNLFGECAWSVFVCMFKDDKLTYGYDNDKATSLPEMSAKHNLDIEVYSTEPGIGFAEHYLIKHGNIEISEECEYDEYYFDEAEYKSFAEFIADYNLSDNLTEDDLTEDDFIIIGGFDSEWHI